MAGPREHRFQVKSKGKNIPITTPSTGGFATILCRRRPDVTTGMTTTRSPRRRAEGGGVRKTGPQRSFDTHTGFPHCGFSFAGRGGFGVCLPGACPKGTPTTQRSNSADCRARKKTLLIPGQAETKTAKEPTRGNPKRATSTRPTGIATPSLASPRRMRLRGWRESDP